MPDLDSHLDQIVDASHDLLDPDEAERVEALAARLLAEQRARGSVPASAPAAVRRDRTRRLRWTGAGAALAGAAAVVLVIAFGPGDAGSSHAHLPAPDTAEAALRSAAASAGKESWQPLGTNDYFHVTTTSYVPDIPESDLGPSDRESMFLAQLYVNESWFGRDGRGKAVSLVGGSGDPSRVPSMYRDPKTGKVLSTGGTRRSDGKPPEVAAGMANPDTVNVMAWPRSDQSAYQRAWVRTRTGFLKTVDIAMSEQAMGAPQDAAATLGQYWGATTAIVEEANANADPDAAAKALVDSFLTAPDPDRDRLATMRMDDRVKVTPAEADREAGIEHAVNLLGSAPLSPNVRKALYRWLAKQPGASVRHGVVDEVGRHGDEVTFEHIRDVPVPTFRVTAR
ncbi:MAG: hypothetical protein H7287_08210, partial [Thermoleophilia bacterium]|nr:hypothetical protein [Thermoleophilia bacterium]